MKPKQKSLENYIIVTIKAENKGAVIIRENY